MDSNKKNFNYSSIKLFDARFVANTLNNSSRCPKCRNEYSYNYDTADKFDTDYHVKSNRPILLPCGHNLCENCVYHNRHNITCVVCASPIAIPKDPTKQFSNFNVRDYFDMNFFLMGQLYHWRYYRKEGSANNTLFMSAVGRSNLNNTLLDADSCSAGASSVVKCVECEAVPSLGKCRICKVYYCKRCFDNVHKNSKVLKMHSLQYFPNEPNHNSEILRLTSSRYCRKHQRPCDRYCKKCDIVCCGECARNDHQHHHFRKLEDENDKLMEELHLTLDNVQLAREILNKGQKDIKAVESEFEDYAIKTMEKISNHFIQLHSFLQNEEKRIIGKFCQMSQQSQFTLHQANVKLNESQETLNTIRSILEGYQHSPPINFYLGHVLPKYNQLIQQMPSNIQINKPHSNPFTFEVKHDVRTDIHDSIQYDYKDPNLIFKIDASFFGSNQSSDTASTSLPSILNMAHNNNLSMIPKTNKKKKNNKKKNGKPTECVSMKNIVADVPNNDGVNLVHITSIQSPEHFYIQNINDMQTIRKLSHTYLCNAMANNIPKEITEGYYYMAYHINDKQWYRGVLKKILPNDLYKIFLVDFGLNLDVSKDKLCDIEENDLKIPFTAVRCAIYDIMPVGKKWTEMENSLLLELLQNKPARISIIERVNNAMFKIDLHTELSKSVRDTFLYTGLARERPGILSFKLHTKANSLPIMKIEERIPKINISRGEIVSVTVLHVEGLEEFYVIKNDMIENLEELKIELNQYYNKESSKVQQIYLGNIHMCCAVNIKDVWYRAQIEEIKEKGQLDVRLVDEGRRELISWRQAFVLVDDFRNKREFAIPCTLADIEPLQENNYVFTAAAIKDFKQMTTNPQLRMDVIAVTSKVYKVALYISKKSLDINIGATLIKNKYGVSTGESTQITEIVKTPEFKNKHQTSELVSTEKPIAAANLNPVKRTLVIVTHVVSPGEFYIQLGSLTQGTKIFHQQIQEAQTKMCGTKEQPLAGETREWFEDNHCLVYTKYHSSQITQPVDGPLHEQFEWYRGIITKISYLPGEEPTFSVFLRDIGVTICSIYCQQLYSIDPQLDRVTNAVYCCHLACVEPAGGKTWSKSSIDSFIHYVNNAETLSVSLNGKRNHDSNSLAIVLWSSKIETSNPLAPCMTKYSNINRSLVRKGLAYMLEPLDTKQQFDRIEEMELKNGEITLDQWFKTFSDNNLLKEIEKKEKLPLHLSGNADDVIENNEAHSDIHPFSNYLNEMDGNETTGQKAPSAWFSSKVITKTLFTGYPTYIDFDCVIYLHEANDKKFLQKITKKLTNTYGAMGPPSADYRFAVDQACVVKYHADGKYYRGIINKNKNSKNEWSVQFIDYGNVESVESKDLRPYAPFPKLPAMACKYIIDGIKPKKGATKFTVAELDQMHAFLVTKLVSIRTHSNELHRKVKRCSMRVGAVDVASDFIQRGLAEADYKPLAETTSLDLSQIESLEFDPNSMTSNKSRKICNPLPYAPDDDYEIFSQGDNNMSVDCNYQKTSMVNVDVKDIDEISDDTSSSEADRDEFDHINEMLDRLSGNIKQKKVGKSIMRPAVETTTNSATNKPPPKKRMFNDNDYTKMMNVMMVYDNDDIVENLDHDYNDNDNNEEEDEDIIELGESFAMNYWHNTAEDMREEEDEEINEQLERRVSYFDEDVQSSDFNAFHPDDTSTVFSHFSGIENFKPFQLPSAMHHFNCRVVSIITPLILQIFPSHTEFRYRDVELQRYIKEMVKRSLPPLSKFQPHTACLACYSKDKIWYRAVIRSYNPTAKTVDVLYVDYLNSETLPLKYVRQCPQELLGWPLRTFSVRLYGLKANSDIKEHDIRMALYKLLPKKSIFAVVKKHPIYDNMDLTKSSSKTDHIEVALYESKEASLKGITIYEPLIENNYFKRS